MWASQENKSEDRERPVRMDLGLSGIMGRGSTYTHGMGCTGKHCMGCTGKHGMGCTWKHGMGCRSTGVTWHGCTGRHGMGCTGRHGMDCRSTGKHGMGCRSIGKHGMGCISTRKHGMGCRSTGKHGMGWLKVYLPSLCHEDQNNPSGSAEPISVQLPPGVSWTDQDSGWCAAGFLAKLSPTVGLNSQHSGMVAIAFPSRPRCALWARDQATLLATEEFGKIEDCSSAKGYLNGGVEKVLDQQGRAKLRARRIKSNKIKFKNSKEVGDKEDKIGEVKVNCTYPDVILERMEALKKMRSPLRGLMTKKVAEIKRMIEDDPSNREEILALHQQLKRLEQRVEALNGKIENLLIEEDASEDLFSAEVEGCDAYERMLTTMEVKVQDALESIAAIQRERNGSTSASMEKRICKLPKLELLKFSGTLKEWLPWWGQFERIHKDDSLSEVDKFHYLHQAVTKGSRAQKFLEGYTVTEANYAKAIEALQEKFGDSVLLTEMYVRQLLELVVERASSQRRTLADLYDPLMASLRSLESLGVTADRNAMFLYPMVESSLPDYVLQIWQRRPEAGYQSGDNTGEPGSSQRLSNLLKFIKEEIRGAERLEFVRAGFKRAEKMPEKEIQRRTSPTAAHLLSQGDSESCVFCDMTGQKSRNCGRAKRMTLEQRRQRATRARVCFRCLGRRHMARDCRSEFKCFACKGRHVELMCSRGRGEVHEKKTEVKEDNLVSPSTSMANQTCSSEVLMMIASARVASPRGQRIVRILFDSGSQRSYIRRALIGQLNLERIGQGQIQKALFGGGMTGVEKHGIYRIQLENIRKVNKIGIDVLEEKTICNRTTSIPMGQWVEELISQHVELNSEDFQNKEIDILIGSDYFGECLTGRTLKLKSGPTAIETILGWILCGRPLYQGEGLVTTMITTLLNQARIEELWDLEVLGIKDAGSDKNRKEHDERVRTEFKKTVKREKNGRYIVALPWRENKEELNDNQAIAYGRLVARTKQLYNTRKFEEYDGVLRDWIREDFIEEIPMGINGSKIHYLPHRPVYKPGSLTTPVRPVFDASCRGANGLAINDCLETGPNLLEILPETLLRFRRGNVGIVADINKAFQTISVQEMDRDCLRFLWWKTGTNETKGLRHKRVVFSLKCSPFLLAVVIEYHLESIRDERKLVAAKLLKSFYVDNCVTSLKEEEVEDFMEISIQLMTEAKMELNQTFMRQHGGHIEVQCDQTIPGPEQFDEKDCTVLHTKKTWNLKLEWDAQLPTDIEKEFRSWLYEIASLDQVMIPRCLYLDSEGDVQLHVFCDASCEAYASVVFARSVVQDTVRVVLLWAKARVAPLKKISVPRLELMACVLGARLLNAIRNALGVDYPTYMWSDSSTAITWITRAQTWNTFVKNRVTEIRNLTDVKSWAHISGDENPADLPSRGCSAARYLKTEWWKGPHWLYKDPGDWPKTELMVNKEEVNMESKECVLAEVALERRWFSTKFSSYSSNLRVIGWIKRFSSRSCKRGICAGSLSAEEIEQAERTMVGIIQREAFEPGKTYGKNLRVGVFSDGLLYVESKLLYSEESEHFRRPFLLPHKHPLGDLMIREEHLRNNHAGTHILMSIMREKFWIIKSRKTIGRIVRGCVKCRRFDQRPIKIYCAPLPNDRTEPLGISQVVGIDLAGPLYLKDGSKVWMVLFTCAVYRAIHLEMVSNLETDFFILALSRFIGRRGRPSTIYSDNGTNLVGTRNLFARLKWDKIVKETQEQRISWKLYPPTAAWWGGFWERMIRMIKNLLKKILGHRKLNYEQLETCLIEVESTINKRPLTYITENSDDLIPLTPAMFLQDRTTHFPEIEKITADTFRRKQRFRKEYLGLLVQKGKEGSEFTLRIGEIVLIGNEDQKRIDWPMAKIEELIPGRDGKIRVARVKTKRGMLMRPIQKIYPLEVTSEEDMALCAHTKRVGGRAKLRARRIKSNKIKFKNSKEVGDKEDKIGEVKVNCTYVNKPVEISDYHISK
ncbi:hypothetical protein LAZ67_3002655 [Cordylochernes scorpioides]|uniref:Integrase catalytic domain-containing protein n=1 Tax=Cordylochernes scorpioides TaxID=51811 RepID=A0ABY6KBB4_9ARAC|nr:hypothetical protein LAZ67_3002655 [Cordylochernes scorpioides]